MANPYIVIRLVPDSPIDGATFATYLDNLQLQVLDALTGDPLSDFAYSSPLILFQLPFVNGFLSVVSAPTSASTTYNGTNYGTTLTLDSTDGIAVGSYVFSADQSTIPASSNLQVVQATETVVTLNNPLPNYVPAGTVVSFLAQAPSGTTTGGAPISFPLPTNSAATTIDGAAPSTTDPLLVLHFASTSGITVGMDVAGTFVAAGTTVAEVLSPTSIIVSTPLTGSPASVTFTLNPPYSSFSLVPLSGTPTANPTTLKFKTTGPNTTNGVAVGMTLAPIPGLVDPGTTVTSVSSTTVTLSRALLGPLPSGQALTFTFPLSAGIVQHYEVLTTGGFPGIVVAPAAVATAILTLNAAPPDYLDITISAKRGADVIPIDNVFYNVLVNDDALPTPDQYQYIPSNETSLYVTLPALPGTAPIPLDIPGDGSAPPYEALFPAVLKALTNDPILGAVTSSNALSLIGQLIASPDYCKRIAYDIVWSYQGALPAPPDPLESLYTCPPNTGGSTGSTSDSTNNLEQDRQKFEGTLNSFYSTRNANAERLTKFVAAVSAAVFCEQTSLNSTTALLEFPVDPDYSFATSVESEILLQGVGIAGTAGLNFGVPAAFFYALGASLDKTTSAVSRFQITVGDAIERLLQQLTVAVDAGVINEKESFADTALNQPDITSFQAARRLVALGVAATSTTPSVAVYAGTPLAKLVNDWLNTLDPTPAPPPNPPLTYQNSDFNIWTQQLSSTDTTGYLDLDLDTITRGWAIPAITSTPTVPTASGSTLTFSSGLGIGVGMPVSGTNIAPGTTVANVTTTGTTTTVTLSAPVTGSVSSVTFNNSPAPIPLATTVDCPSGSTLTFGSTTGISEGMLAAGLNIVAGATVHAVTTTTVTISVPVTADVPKGTVITFAVIPDLLADQIAQWLPTTTNPSTPKPTVATLKQVSAKQWTDFFNTNPTWLPPFTQPVAPGAAPAAAASQSAAAQKAGYIALRIRAFIRAVQEFFTVSSVATTAQFQLPGAPGTFALPSFDPIAQAVSDLGSFSFDSATSTAQLASGLTTAVQTVFPNDPAAQAWLSQAMNTINELDEIARVVPNPAPTSGFSLPNPVSFSFSVMEALYARGFRSAKDITKLSAADFQQAMTGTIAYDFANSSTNSLYQQALTIAPSSPSSSPTGGSFEPINPGSLVNCVPPPCLSPTGPIAYLQEMLQLSQASTCADPFAPPAAEQMTLGAAVTARRGPIGTLTASCANLETPLPLIDIVKECLEYLGTAPATPTGTVYNTSAGDLAATLAALPEYSTPATPVSANQSVQPLVYNNLKVDFSSCHLPYSQALDVSRTYLRHFGTCRFEELRTFRKCITEFALSPANPPAGFQSYQWRFPVRIETAIEYLGITPEEYTLLFQGTSPQPCSAQAGTLPGQGTVVSADELFGLSTPSRSLANELANGMALSDFLTATCLTYCEFVELSKSGFAQLTTGTDGRTAALPECEPCCLGDYRLQLPGGDRQQTSLLELGLFIRLWRKLKDACGAGYTFAQLSDICSVLKLTIGGAINPEFIRQLAAFQMLRDYFNLPLFDPADKTTGTTGADRTHLLALWVGSSAAKWNWAVHQFLEGIESHARTRYRCERPRGEAVSRMASNLDALSRLAGFNPAISTDTWNSTPGCTLRFAEVLAKICASSFRIEELIGLFDAVPPPFPLQESDDALNYPFDQPEDDQRYSLWKLREALLAVEVREEDACHWTWPKLVAAFRAKFGYAPPSGQDPLLSIGQHFFPKVLAASGFSVSATQRQYRTALTSTTVWNTPAGSPFQYDAGSSELWIEVPFSDEAVAAKLSQLPQLNSAEQAAVQDLYFAPRVDLAFAAFLFPDWQSAEIHLIQEHDEAKRWSYFRYHFALADARRKVIAEHLTKHVEHCTGCRPDGLDAVAGLVLGSLFADENTGTPWESDAGIPPAVMWTPPPSGGAIPALLGLIGTGLLGEYESAQSQTPLPATATTAPSVLWREVRAPLEAFGHERDLTDCPVPTMIPALAASSVVNPLVNFQNGYAVKTADGQRLGGAEGFSVRWCGVLLVEGEGEYAFHAGAPAPDDEAPDVEKAEKCQWRVTLKRGQKTWVVLNHQWPGDPSPERNVPRLRRGAYQITIEFNRPTPDFSSPQIHPQHTGFQLKYAGPDTDFCIAVLPVKRLYRDFKDQTLDQGIQFLPGSKNAQAFLKAFYTSTIRDIRRTYQRAFKAVLFCGKLGLSAHPVEEHGQSELGYLLANPANFAGYAYYRTNSTGFAQHMAYFNFNFLPLIDNYHPPTPVPGDRSDPSLQQTQAMFDWWERIFDYDLVRKETHRSSKGHLWQLFLDAQVQQPSNPAQLLRFIGADPDHRAIDLRFYQDQSAPIYNVTDIDLEDERWLVRVWRADRWLRRLVNRFHPKSMSRARPDVWASQDPSAPMPASGVSETGNANLAAFLDDGCLDNGEPRRYLDLQRLNDGLRERGRDALIAYLCTSSRVQLTWAAAGTYATEPSDLSDLLLLDVETGVCEKASRIEEAISAVQTFIRRSRLGLEPDWPVSREFVRLWDGRFDTYRTWERCKRRELYRENWIEWTELGKARRIEAFRFLESELRSSTLTLASPGGLDWWADDVRDLEHKPELLERRVPSELQALSGPTPTTTREGLGTLGTPEYAARPTWLAAIPQPNATTPPAGTSSTIPSLAQAAATGAAQPQNLPLWMESAMKLGTRFVRVAAASIPPASLGFVPHSENPQNACCHQCGHDHPVLVDEYYFWLVNCQFYTYTDQTDAQSGDAASFSGSYQFGFQDSYYDQFQQQSAEWNDETQIPKLLANWKPQPAVRLAWCRVHNGEFRQPRRSTDYVATAGPADLQFLGRAEDSLYFQISGNAPLPPGYGDAANGEDTSPPGFRYDLPPDEAVALPQVLKPPASSSYPGGLPSYPFFAYYNPGARLFPGSWFSTSLAAADTLRAHCSFEAALRWYKRAFNPLQQDCTWMVCGSPAGDDPVVTESTVAPAPTNSPSSCCDSTKVTEAAAKNRALTLHYCQTLLDWGDHLMRRRSPEAFQQARLIYDTVARITGPCPQTILLPDPTTSQTVSTFAPAFPPLNPRLMDLYSFVADRRELIHHCLDLRRLRNGRPGLDMPYFGDSPWRDGWRAIPECCADEECCSRLSPYRFTFQIQKTIELVGRVRDLGSALLTAFEQGDAECLAQIRAGQEREMMALALSIKQDQWRDADWQIQALQQTKDVSQTNLLYYTNLYQNGLINDETQNLNLATNAMVTRTGANISEALAEAMKIVPDFNVGAMSTFSQVPIGTKLAGVFETLAKIMLTVADIQSETAAIDFTEAGWQRRSDDWFHQMVVLPIEIQQIELQILGAQRRRDQAMQDLNNQQRLIEHATEIQDFLRDKFTAMDVYLWLQRETSTLYSRMYELALCSALEAQRAFNFERGHTTRRFIPDDTWDNPREGLLAGERLDLAVRRMEKAYYDENVREYELTKHFSLRLHFPVEFLRLKVTGCCEIELPEWMFDLDYPGQYMRRIKNISLTIPCVTGPYTGVHCRVTLLSSLTRIDPRLDPPATRCCCECGSGAGSDDGYETCPHDPRVVRMYGAREAIATSSGQNDTGVFDLGADQRYAPFEFQGAVCRLRIELRPEDNYFPMETLTDFVVHHNYTSREGGEMLRRAARQAAKKHLPGSGWCFFDVRHEFPDAWELLRDSFGEKRNGARLDLRLDRKMFPFIPGAEELSISSMAILFSARAECDPPAPGECPCPCEGKPACRVVEFTRGPQHHGDPLRVSCLTNEEWPDLYTGFFDAHVGPLGGPSHRAEVQFRFPADTGKLERVFLLCRYQVEADCTRRGVAAGVKPVSNVVRQ